MSVCMYSAGYCCQILTKLDISRHIFEKSYYYYYYYYYYY
jgi:hypothetical protein